MSQFSLIRTSGDGISTNTRQSTVSSVILLNIEGSLYQEFRQEMVSCACVCPYAGVASVLTCLFLCLYAYVLVKTIHTCSHDVDQTFRNLANDICILFFFLPSLAKQLLLFNNMTGCYIH